jgi:outer membrane protein TolC
MKIITLMLVFVLSIFVTTGIFAGGQKEKASSETSETSVPKESSEQSSEESPDAMGQEEEPEGPVSLTVAEAVEMALDNNLAIQAEQLGLKIKNRTRQTVWNQFYPSISASTSLSRMHVAQELSITEYTNSLDDFGIPGTGNYTLDPPGITSAIPFDDDGPVYDYIFSESVDLPRWNISAGINMNLTLTAALIYGIKFTVIDYQAGQLSLETAKKSLSRDIKKAFYNLLLLEENIKILELQVESLERRFEQAQINYDFGLVDEYTKLSAQVGLENLRPGVDALKTGYEIAKMNFKFLLGMDLDRDILLEGSIEPEAVELDVDDLIATYVTERLDIQSLRKQIEILKNSKNATIAGMTPLLTFILNFDPVFLGDPFEDPWFERNDDDELNWEQLSGMFAVSLTLPLDQLLPFSSSWVDISNTKDGIRQLYTTMQQAIDGAQMEIWTLVQNLEQTRKTYEALELNVDLAQRAYDLAEESYNAGGRALIDVEDAEDKLQEAKFEVLREKYNYISNLMDLEYALNTPLEELRK